MMAFVRPVSRKMPKGDISMVFPYHVSFEGLEKNIICRDDEDCDILVKTLAVCARRKNVVIIIYAVVSNHAHVAVLAKTYEDADAFAKEVKRTYSMLFRKKYGEAKSLKDTTVNVQILDTEWYLRNALAYVPRNAYDNGADSLFDYKWTGFRACFRKGNPTNARHKVSEMTFREWRAIMHTGDDLSDTTWELNSDNELEPDSFCDYKYLEDSFNGDQSFFYKCIGIVNISEMNQKLVVSPRKMKTDSEFLKELNDLSERWYSVDARNLPESKKARLLPYVFRTMKTSIPQVARAMGMSRDEIQRLL